LIDDFDDDTRFLINGIINL